MINTTRSSHLLYVGKVGILNLDGELRRLFTRHNYDCLIQQLSDFHQNIYISANVNQQSFPTPCHPLFTVDFANIDTLFCNSSFVTFRCKFPSDSSTAERMLFIIPSPTKLRGDIVMLPSVRPSVRHNPCEHSRINILQWILTKLGTYLVLKRSWNPIDFQGQKSRSQGQIFTA
jgi:hypothetical protein